MTILVEYECGGRTGRPAATNSSTEMALASRAWCCSSAIAHLRTVALSSALLLLLVHNLPALVPLPHPKAMRVGRKIWQNECGGTLTGLTSWNAGENFASLGIGHFIWYPAGVDGPFEESFPKLVRYVQSRGAKLPRLLLGSHPVDCPWRSRAEFVAAESSPEMKQLRRFLVDTIDLQADFLVRRMRDALPKMLAAAPVDERQRIERQFDRIASSAEGCYALIDYVNFKGEGILATERYRGRGWGLLQVLESMSGQDHGVVAVNEFADSAAIVLRERVTNSPPARDEARWLPGWLNRVASYREGSSR